MLVVATSSGRDKKRDRERLSRQRRAEKLQQLRQIYETLERAVVVSQTFDDADAVWDDFLDEHTVVVRGFLRKSLQLTKEAEDLQLERALLVRLLDEHRLSAKIATELLRELPQNDWEMNVARWRALARTHFKPWSLDDCKVEIEAAYKEVSAFDWSLDKESTSMTFLGWREQRRVDTMRGTFQFQFHKTFRGYEMMDYVNVMWDMYTDPKTFQQVLIGSDAPVFHEVLQQLGPNIMIVWDTQQYHDFASHMTRIVCRSQTERGIVQCVRSIVCPELMKAVDGPENLWTSNYMWKQCTRLEGDQPGYTLRFGGSLVGQDVKYLNHWMFRIFEIVLRSERLATGRQLLTSE